MIDLKILIKNGVQFGHQAWRWSPKMRDYIWGKKNGVHLIDVSKTAIQLQRSAQFLESVAAEGKQVLWVGTKRSAQEVVTEYAKKLESPFVCHRWIGGTLTNFSQVKKSVTKLLHYEDILKKTEQHSYTKKEFGVFQKLVDRLSKNVGGIRDLTWPIGALVVVDARKEAVAIKEAQFAGIPVVALVDTNSDPSGIDHVIPGNDDVPRAIRVIVSYLADAVEAGKKQIDQRKKEHAARLLAAKGENIVKDSTEDVTLQQVRVIEEELSVLDALDPEAASLLDEKKAAPKRKVAKKIVEKEDLLEAKIAGEESAKKAASKAATVAKKSTKES